MDGQTFTYNSFRGKFRDRRQALTKSAAAEVFFFVSISVIA